MNVATDKTLGCIYRETIKQNLKKNIKDSSNFFIAHYKGLKASEVNQLRKELTKVGARISVVRNRLTRLLLDELKLKDVSGSINGPTAFIFGSDDPVNTSKTLVNFSKEYGNLKIELAYVDNKILNEAVIKELSSLPPREVLLARIIGGIKSPLNGLGNVLSGALRKLVLVFDALAKVKKEQAPVKEEAAQQPPEEAAKQQEAQGTSEQEQIQQTPPEQGSAENKKENPENEQSS